MIMRTTAAAAALVFMLSPARADTFNINVNNGEMEMLLLTITDMNYPDPKEVFSGNLTSGQMRSVYINGENGRNGHIKWKASTADRKKCGSDDVTGLGSGSNITIRTKSAC